MRQKTLFLSIFLLAVVVAGSVSVGLLTEVELPFPEKRDLKKTTSDNNKVVTMFVGDMMFDRYIRRKANERGGYTRIMSDFATDFRDADLVVGNLEGPITSRSSISINTSAEIPEHFIFTFSPQTADLLSEMNFKMVSVGNNHIANFGAEGVEATRAFLRQTGVKWFGDTYESDYFSTSLIENDQSFTFVAYNQFLKPDLQTTLQEIRQASNSSDWVIVYAHWGNEYEHTPREQDIERAHEFVDAGADLVIGAHPHVIQTKETYNGTPIYYSLGNFVFDQYFREDVRCGLVLTVTFGPESSLAVGESTSYLRSDGTTTKQDCALPFEQ